MSKYPPRPRDPNQLGKLIVDMATSVTPKDKLETTQQKAGRLGGLKGGKVRIDAMSTEDRSKLGKKGAKARWNKK